MTLTLTDIEAIEKGTAGVTPGPYRRHESDRETSVVADTGTVVVVPWEANTTAFRNAHRDAAHIARLSPEVVSELCRLAKIGLAAEPALEQIANGPTFALTYKDPSQRKR